MIDVIVPVLHRPQNIPTFMESLTDSAPEAQAWFICEVEDQEEQDTALTHGAKVLVHPAAHTFAQKCNLGYRSTSAPWMLLVGDDVLFHDGWLEEVLRVAAKTGANVVSTNDLLTDDVVLGEGACHPVIRRCYVDELGASWDGPGILMHEGYRHHGPDTEVADVAIHRRTFAPALGAVIEHLNPRAGKAQNDAIYDLATEHWPQDEALFYERRAQFLPGGRDLSLILK
jgi:hypothetical protein